MRAGSCSFLGSLREKNAVTAHNKLNIVVALQTAGLLLSFKKNNYAVCILDSNSIYFQYFISANNKS